jgi:hypothetical protein
MSICCALIVCFLGPAVHWQYVSRGPAVHRQYVSWALLSIGVSWALLGIDGMFPGALLSIDITILGAPDHDPACTERKARKEEGDKYFGNPEVLTSIDTTQQWIYLNHDV